MKKKFLSVFMIVTMLFSMITIVPMTAHAAEEGDWTYTLYDGDTTAAITGYLGSNTEITIPSSIAGKPVTRIGSNAFMDNTLITSVTIPDSVLRIEASAFQYSTVNAIDLGEGLTYIGQLAFHGSSLTSVTIPDSVTHIDDYAFAYNRNLTSLTINGNNLLTLGEAAFSITGLSTIRIPTSLSTIEGWTFADTYLSSLTIPANITSLGYYAFGNNPSLSSVLFEGNAPTMADYVFSIPSSGFTVYYYSGATGFTTPTWVAGYATLNTAELDAPSNDVCQIGSTGYESLSDALAAAINGDTIILLKDIEYLDQIAVTDKHLTFDLNSFTLNITNTTGTALEVGSGGKLSLTGEGALNVYGNELYGYGVYAHDGGEASVTNASASGYSTRAAYALNGGIINVSGNATGTATSLGTGTYCRGAQADGTASLITVGGNVSSINNYGAVAEEEGTVVVEGDVSGFYGGAYTYNGDIQIDGNATGINEGAYAIDGTISVGGNAIATGNGGYGAFASGVGASITVTGDAISQGDYGSGAFAGNGAVAMIGGDAVSLGNDGYGAHASQNHAMIEVSGNIVAENGTGAWVRLTSSITVNGTITATDYIKIQDQIYGIEENAAITTKAGYRTYSDGTANVWVSLEQPAERLFGSNRYSTAVNVSQAGWDHSSLVLLARGDDYADALAGVPLAYLLDAPILLSSTSQIGTTTLDEIERLGATRVIILGGTSAISAGVETVLTGKGLTVERISGSNRYHTAVLTAEYMWEKGARFDSAVIAVGTNFPDALAAASYAAIQERPILLTGSSTLSSITKEAIESMGIEDTIVVGGTSVISDAVLSELAQYGTAVRIAGSNRYSTAVEIAKHFNLSVNHYYIATGLNFPDAITGAVLAAKYGTGVLLVQGTLDIPNLVVRDFITIESIRSVTLFGGTSVVSEGIENWFIDNL